MMTKSFLILGVSCYVWGIHDELTQTLYVWDIPDKITQPPHFWGIPGKTRTLERLRSEIPLAAPCLPILAIHTRSQVKTRQS